MDGLSIASGLAGLITLVDIIISRSYHYIKYCRGAAKDAHRLLGEAQGLMGVLQSLRTLESQVDEQTFQAKVPPEQLYRCHKLLEDIRATLSDADPTETTSQRQKIQRTLTWKWKAEKTEEILAEMERHKSAFNLVFSMESLEAILQNSSDQRDIAKEIADIKETLLRIELTRDKKEMLDFFGAYDSEPNQQMSAKLKQPGTGIWLIESQEMNVWRQQSNSKLWLYGIPGAGKTVIAGMLVQEAVKLATPFIGVAYHYCDYKKAKSRVVQYALASLVGQLATQNAACEKLLRKTYQPAQEQIRTLPDVDDLSRILRQMSKHFDDVAIVIDAVDESDDPGDFVQFFGDIVNMPASNIKLAVLSRYEQAIILRMDKFAQIAIAARNEDLKLFVAAQIEERTRKGKLRIKSADLKNEIAEKLMHGAHGMFRWVVCQMDHLCELPSDGARRKALQTLPPDLATTYDRILERIGQREHVKRFVHRVLMWLMPSEYHRPIKARQVCQAIAIEYGDTMLNAEDVVDPEDILLYCGSLVRLSQDWRY